MRRSLLNYRYKTSSKKGQFKCSTGPRIFFPSKNHKLILHYFHLLFIFIYFLNLRSKNSALWLSVAHKMIQLQLQSQPLLFEFSSLASHSTPSSVTLSPHHLTYLTCQRPPRPIWLLYHVHQTYHQSCRKLPARSGPMHRNQQSRANLKQDKIEQSGGTFQKSLVTRIQQISPIKRKHGQQHMKYVCMYIIQFTYIKSYAYSYTISRYQ